MQLGIIALLSEEETSFLGCQKILAGPGSPWTAPWFGSRARVFASSEPATLHREDGVALLYGTEPSAMASLLAGVPDPVVLVGTPTGKGLRVLEKAAQAKRKAGQDVRVVVLEPGVKVTLEVREGTVRGWMVHDPLPPTPGPAAGEG